MIEKITITDRGAVPRRLRPATNAALKLAYADGATYFHEELRDRRFTEAHGQAAGYRKRNPKYQQRKHREFGHRRPLERSGDVRDRVERQYRIVSSRNWGRVVYSGARGFNRRHRATLIDMVDEFTRILPEENEQFAVIVDRRLDAELGDNNFVTTRTVG